MRVKEFDIEYDGKYVYPCLSYCDHMKISMGSKFYVYKIYEDDNMILGTISSTPLTMRKKSNGQWVSLPPQNSNWMFQNNDIFWEWYPDLDYSYMDSTFWPIVLSNRETTPTSYKISSIEERSESSNCDVNIIYDCGNFPKNLKTTGIVTHWIDEIPWRIISRIDSKLDSNNSDKNIISIIEFCENNEVNKESILNLCHKLLNGSVHIEKIHSELLYPDISHIMIVDDMTLNRKLLKKRLLSLSIFDNRKLIITDVKDGNEAIETFQQFNGEIDIIFMDCVMPRKNGFEASNEIHKICEENHINKTPIVAVTGFNGKEIENKCKSNGMSHILIKPINNSDIFACLNDIFK